jgi:hypothetical protein
MRWLARDTISLENQLRFGDVVSLKDVEGVSFDRCELVWRLVGGLVWVFFDNPFEVPGVWGDPPFGCGLIDCEPNAGGADGDADAVEDLGGSLSIGLGFNVDPRTVV